MAQGSIDFAYRVSSDTIVVSGWCFEADETPFFSWRVPGSDWRSQVLGATRVRRPDVVEALGCAGTQSPDCGFLLVLVDVPADLEHLNASILGLLFECLILDLRRLSLASALARLLELTHWGFTPADRAEGLLKHQGLVHAVLSLLAGSDHSWIQQQIVQLNSSRCRAPQSKRWRLLLCCSHDPEFLRLQLTSFFEALVACGKAFDLILLPHPGWILLDPDEWARIKNLVALMSDCNVSVLSWEASCQSAHAVINEQLGASSCDSVVVLGSALLPASSAALSQLQSVLHRDSTDQDLSATWGQHDVTLSLPLLLGDGGCCLLRSHAHGCELQAASKAVWSCFQEWSCLEPQPAPGVVKGLAFWRYMLRWFVTESMMVAPELL